MCVQLFLVGEFPKIFSVFFTNAITDFVVFVGVLYIHVYGTFVTLLERKAEEIIFSILTGEPFYELTYWIIIGILMGIRQKAIASFTVIRIYK